MPQHEGCKEIAVFKESLKVANHRIEDLEKEITQLKREVSVLENTTVRLETILTRLEHMVDNLSKGIEKAKWFLITGFLSPIILAVIMIVINQRG